MLVSFLIFLFFTFFFVIFPGKIILNSTGREIENDPLIDLGLSTGLGMVILVLLSIFVRLIKIDLLVLWILPVICTIYIIIRKINFSRFNSSTLVLLLLIIIGTFAQTRVLLHGGYTDTRGEFFPAFHDSLWNVSVVAELFYHFPPQHPGIAGLSLKNNHYFYHLYLATTAYITHINILDLYYKFGPLLVSFIFGLSLYAVISIFTKKTFFRGFGIFLGYFSGSFAYMAPFFLGKQIHWQGNIFLSDQPFDQIINPYTVLGFSLFLIGCFCFQQVFLTGRQSSRVWIIITALLFGTLYGFKSFGGILALITFFLTSIILFALYRKINIFYILLLTLFIFIPIFLFMTQLGSASLNWIPGWTLTAMVADKDRLNLPQLAATETYYLQIHNYLGFLKIKSFEFIIYFVGNLGIRLVGFVYLIVILVCLLSRKKISQNTPLIIFLTLSIIISLTIPLLFNLSLNAYDIMQFTPYALIILALMTSLAAEAIYKYFSTRKLMIQGMACIILILLLALPQTIENFRESFNIPQTHISADELQALNFIKYHSHTDDVILINPLYFSDSMYISALSERRLYIGDPSLVNHTGLNPAPRLKAAADFFNGISTVNFLRDNQISFIYQPKKITTSLNSYRLIKVYENDSIEIYTTNL